MCVFECVEDDYGYGIHKLEVRWLEFKNQILRVSMGRELGREQRCVCVLCFTQ